LASEGLSLWQARCKKIQLPFTNRFNTIWEYKKSFLAGQIDFISFIGSACPLCGEENCYRKITPYWRNAIDLFPEFKEAFIPVARFLCRKHRRTFSLLPTQLIPYYQYTVHAVTGALLLGLKCRESGYQGFHGAAAQIDADSRLTPWLVAYWLMVVVRWLRRAHHILRLWYDLSGIRSMERRRAWDEAADYFFCLGWKVKIEVLLWSLLETTVNRYSRTTKFFLFGTSSQERIRRICFP
jgi:hypothetical protein